VSTKLFSELGLSPESLKAIARMGFEQASPIQAEAIPILMQGKDVVGQSQTGSGKTVAFAVPAVEKVDPASKRVQVLILCPTRELAVQVAEEVHKLLFFKRGIHALPIYGGQSYERQLHGLQQGSQIVIGTPGRVMDHMRRGTLRLDQVKMVILDEADVMLNMGFRDDIEIILQAVPKERQTVFFCATMPRPIRDLIERYAREPQNVRIQQKTLTVPTVEQVYFEVDRRYKIELLTRLIDLHDLKLGIIFCNTKAMVDDLVEHLEAQGYSADRLHGDMNQAQRDRVMNKFRKSGLEFLVATDVAARGIDVDDVEVVFNYDLPYDVEDYVHRIGRTGRAGRSGRAISFVSGREVFQIRNIERYTNMRVPRGRIPTRDEAAEARVNLFLEKLRETLRGEEFRRHEPVVERLLEEGFSSTDVAAALLHHLKSGDDGPSASAPRPAAAPRQPWAEERTERPVAAAPTTPRPVVPRVKKVVIPPPHKRIPAPRPAPPPTASAAPSPPPAADPAPQVVPPAPPPEPLAPVPQVPEPPSLIVTPLASVAPAVIVAPAPEAPLPVDPPPAEISRPPADSPPVRSPKLKAAVPEPGAAPRKKEPRTPAHQTRLWMSVGEEHGVAPIDVVNQVAGLTGLPGRVVGKVDVRERHLFADVDTEHLNAIIAKLNRSELKGHRLKVKAA
jgi:ATP-dependent RNA helicase DeaD